MLLLVCTQVSLVVDAVLAKEQEVVWTDSMVADMFDCLDQVTLVDDGLFVCFLFVCMFFVCIFFVSMFLLFV